MKGSTKPKFSFRLWYWTCASENLFDLTPDELALFAGFAVEAFKTKTPTRKKDLPKAVADATI